MRRIRLNSWMVVALAIGIGAAVNLPGPADTRNYDDRARILYQIGADRWHRAGFRGQSVKVAILDTGFRGYREFLGSCLPNRVTAKSFRHDGDLESKDSRHGILCGEVVHAVAPDAELLFANWEPNSPESFVAAIAWAGREGARAVSCSIIMPCWSDGEGGGPVHQALHQVLGDGEHTHDVLGVACAGNIAERHWAGLFRGEPGGLHHWPDGSTDNVISAWGDELVSVELCRPGDCGYVLIVTDANGREVGRASAVPGDGKTSMFVRFAAPPGQRFAVRVRHAHGAPGPFHLTTLGAAIAQHSARGSIPFPGDGAEWLTVGAWENNRRAIYSSCGPNSHALKPDLVGPVPFPSRWRDQPFGGTSAAAPQAAGLAALVWSRFPEWTAADVKLGLRATAEDLLAPGHDTESGFGMLRLK